jgi:hypothetical protein
MAHARSPDVEQRIELRVPGVKVAVISLIAGLAFGKPDYGRSSEGLARSTRSRSLRPSSSCWASDHFDVKLANGASDFRILLLCPMGASTVRDTAREGTLAPPSGSSYSLTVGGIAMSLFESIKKAIFYNPMARGTAQGKTDPAHATRPATPATATRPAAGTSTSQAKPASQPAAAAPASAAPVASTAAPASAPAANPPAAVDIEAVLDGLAARNPQKLNWRTSIVDLMKLVDLDSSLKHRQELAAELGYDGDRNDSAAMNIWLHRAVMKKLAENGGKVPATLQ